MTRIVNAQTAIEIIIKQLYFCISGKGAIFNIVWNVDKDLLVTVKLNAAVHLF